MKLNLLFTGIGCIVITLSLVAQTDTLEIQRRKDGKIAFASFKPNTDRKMAVAVTFLHSVLQLGKDGEMLFEKAFDLI